MFKIKKLAQFKKEIKNLHLTENEKELTQNNIEAYMKMHPVRKNEVARLKSQTGGNILFFNTQHMYAKLATFIILLSGTGTAFAAENTLPGDPLYNVKVHINEPVRAALAVSTEAKANWQTTVAERRLDEASRLAAEGKLSTQIGQTLENRFTIQTEKIKESIAKLQETGKTDIAAELGTHLESVIEIHTQILDTIQNEDGKNKNEIKQDLKPLLDQLKTDVKEMHEIKVKIEDENKLKIGQNTKIAAQNHMNLALKQIETATEEMNSYNLSSTSSVALKIAEAKAAYDIGRTQFNAEDYTQAFGSFSKAQKFAVEAKVMVHVQTNIKIDDRIENIFKRLDTKGLNLNEDQKIKIEDTLQNRLENKIENRIEDRIRENVEERKENRKDKIDDKKLQIDSNLHVSDDLKLL